MRISFRKLLPLFFGALILGALIFHFFAQYESVNTNYSPTSYSKILLVGFEPFGEEPLNSSWEAVDYWNSQLKNNRFSEVVFQTIELPVDYEESVRTLMPILNEWDPDLILMFGMYWNDNGVRLERFARSRKLLGEKETTRLPIAELVDAYNEAGIEVYVSDDAGSYVCNYLFYSVMDYLKQEEKNHVVAGFIHVPRVNRDGFTIPVLSKVVDIAVTSILGYDKLN